LASFSDCINQAFKAGKITKTIADQLNEAEDVETAIKGLTENITRQKREAAIQAVRIAKAIENMESYPKSQYDGLMALMTKDPTGKAPYANVEYLANSIRGQFHAKWADAMSRLRTRKIGFSQDEKALNNLAKAIYGESIDDPEIQGFAKQWIDLTEQIRQRFNASGGSISKNERWLMPQNHDMSAVAKVGREAWKESIINKLDRTQMTDDFGKPLDDAQLKESLDFVYETITTGGMNKAKDSLS